MGGDEFVLVMEDGSEERIEKYGHYEREKGIKAIGLRRRLRRVRIFNALYRGVRGGKRLPYRG